MVQSTKILRVPGENSRKNLLLSLHCMGLVSKIALSLSMEGFIPLIKRLLQKGHFLSERARPSFFPFGFRSHGQCLGRLGFPLWPVTAQPVRRSSSGLVASPPPSVALDTAGLSYTSRRRRRRREGGSEENRKRPPHLGSSQTGLGENWDSKSELA